MKYLLLLFISGHGVPAGTFQTMEACQAAKVETTFKPLTSKEWVGMELQRFCIGVAKGNRTLFLGKRIE